jgi:hypothetical protein
MQAGPRTGRIDPPAATGALALTQSSAQIRAICVTSPRKACPGASSASPSARLAFGVALPGQFAGFLVTNVLAATAMPALLLLIAALAPTGRAAGGIGTLLFYPLIFFARPSTGCTCARPTRSSRLLRR